tara:strand:- start:73 stop:180 length:108 start_codon:yes stop_codon:yes gene_type:complete
MRPCEIISEGMYKDAFQEGGKEYVPGEKREEPEPL